MIIDNRCVGEEHSPFVIAEMSGNHNQSLEKALEIAEAAAIAGVHALKLQTYTADTLTLDVDGGDFLIRDKNSPWNGKRLYDLYQEASTPWDWHETIFERAHKLGILCFSTPFDESAVDFLEELDVPAYKIASFENNHLPLIRKVAATGKPVIISTGLATLDELSETVQAVRSEGCKNFALLKCTSSYPANPKHSNLLTIPHMKELFNCEVGLSDHTLGIGAAVAAVGLGASIIEKHFTLKRSEGGPDASFSMEPKEMSMLVAETTQAWSARGGVVYGPTDGDRESSSFRRSLYVSQNIRAGETLTSKNIRIVRPGFGLAPRYMADVLGKEAKNDLTKGTALRWSDIK
jgi:N-acetylneuraminate synthase